MKISAVVLTKNEEAHLATCLSSLSFCDEIILIDNNSIDKTVEIAKKHGVTVYTRALSGNFAAQRNFGLSKAKGDWILFIDADETVTEQLRESIQNALKNTGNSAFYLKRRDFWWGRELKYGETSTVRTDGLVRLVRKDSGKWVGSVHETFQTSGPTSRLEGFIDHHPHPTVSEFIAEVNFYSTLRAKELKKQGKRAGLLQIVAYPKGKFIYTYFVKRGFLDGPAGFAYAFFMSFHSFLVRAKLYQYRTLS